MRVVLIAALTRDGTIGRDGDLPWRLRDDLKHFKRATVDKPILMGRKTWESLPGVLPRRRHLVLSRRPDYAVDGAEVFATWDAAVEAVGDAEELCVVGGAAIYALALPQADVLLLTHVDADVEGDVRFPDVPWDAWEGEELARFDADERNEHPFRIVRYTRRA